MRLLFELEIDEQDLREAVEFIHGRSDYVDRILQDFFPEGRPINMDMQYMDQKKKQFFLGGFVSSMIVFQEEQTIAIEKKKQALVADAFSDQSLSKAMKDRLNARGISDDEIRKQGEKDRNKLAQEQNKRSR